MAYRTEQSWRQSSHPKPVRGAGWMAWMIAALLWIPVAWGDPPTPGDGEADDPKEKIKSLPLSFSIDYTLVSDYIFRGINFSEYSRATGATRNEGREALNHQMSIETELDLGSAGRIGGGAWFEWYADQDNALNAPGDNKHLQEIDYFVYYGYLIEALGLDWQIGFTWYDFPRASAFAEGATGDNSADLDSTQELFTTFAWDDSPLWRAMGFSSVKDPILNPYYTIAWDLDLANGGSYHEFGMSHEFSMSDLLRNAPPILRDVSVTPSWAMGWSHNWLDNFSLDPSAGRSNYSGLMNMVWGLNVTLDLKSVFNIPDEYCGGLYLSGFINYSHALADHFLDDQFWGGMSVGYEW